MKLFFLIKKIKEFKINNEQLNEENTKIFCILPLFKYLGYDVFSPTDILYEYRACLREDKSEKCDFVILNSNKDPFIVVETKSFGKDLSQYSGQLKSYFVATSAKYAILTNGDDYWFYDASQKSDIKDKEPIKRIKLSDLNIEDISYLNNYIKNIILPIDGEKLSNINKETAPIVITKEVIKEVVKTKKNTNSKHRPKSKSKSKSEKESSKDSVDLFIETLDSNMVVGKQKEIVFNEYIAYCNNNNYIPESNQLLTRKIKALLSLNIQSKHINGVENKIFINAEYLIKMREEEQRQREEKEKLSNHNFPSGNSVYKFYQDNPLLVIRNKPTDEIYGLYINYCNRNNLEKKSKIDFSKKINKYYNVKTIVKSVDGKVRRIFI